MASWMPAYFQKRLLRAALSRVALLDVDSLDLDSLGVKIGRSSTVELRNVHLRLEELSALLQLPPNIRLLVARVISLRLTVPANFFQQSIVAEVDGVDVQVALDAPTESRDNVDNSKTPQHRKTNRRIHSPPPLYDTGGLPSTQRLAQSILQEEPVEEKQELEARYMAKSSLSDSSEESALGTGTNLGLPGVIAAFLQGIVDRAQLRLNDVNLRLSLQTPTPEAPSTMLIAHVAGIQVDSATAYADASGTIPAGPTGKRRRIAIQGLGLHLLCEEQLAQTQPFVADLFAPQANDAPIEKEEQAHSTVFKDEAALQESGVLPHNPFLAEAGLSDSDSESIPDDMAQSTASFGIRPGEDNISWTSRRSHSSSDRDQLWSSFAPEEDQSTSGILQDMSSSIFLSTIDTQEPQSPIRRSAASLRASHSAYNSPILHQSRDSRAGFAESEHDENVDNGVSHAPLSPSEHDGGTDLTESVVYSHAQAESMYMSALGQEPASPNLKALPGGWASVLDDDKDLDPPFLSQHLDQQPGYESEDRASTPRLRNHSPVSQRLPESDPEEMKEPTSNYVSKEILTMRNLTIGVRQAAKGSSRESSEDSISQSSVTTSGFYQQAPGAFSIYAEGGRSSVRFNAPPSTQISPDSTEVDEKMDTTVEIEATPINLQVDADTVRSIHSLFEPMILGVQPSKEETQQKSSVADQPFPTIVLKLETFCVRLFQNLPQTFAEHNRLAVWRPGPPTTHEDKPLLQLNLQQVGIQTIGRLPTADVDMHMENLTFTAGSKDILSFDLSKGQQKDQTVVRRAIHVASRSKATMQGQTVREINVQMLPLRLDLDVVKFDEDFSTLGGLTGIVEMSSSLLSSGAFSNKPDTSPPPRRGVRFQEAAANESALYQTKVSARIEGFVVRLTSKACCLELQASKTKVVSRESYVAVVIDKANLDMPMPCDSTRRSDFDVALGHIRLLYFFSPEEQDLGRLLSLVAPSKNKYEDDDILIQTLLRQRKKGSVLRIQATSFQTFIHDWAFVPHLQSLGDELSKLSAVAKYLPEDDTPGVMLLFRLEDTYIQVPVNDQFGPMTISLKGVQAAQVGLPALFALSVGVMHIRPIEGDDILHEVLPDACSEGLPMLMARMVGDEVEPVVKVKLFNICVEYSIPVLLALTSTRTATEVEQKVQDLAASVLESSTSEFKESVLSASGSNKSSGSVSKKLAVDVLLHDCALGLQPKDMESKAIFLLKNTKFGTAIPPTDAFEATLDVREATLFVVDDAVESPNVPASPGPASQLNHSLRLQTHLSNKGYVSVSSIRSARAVVCVVEGSRKPDKFVDVEFRNEFFLLETCADSTQTLIAILNGLAPPAIANDDPTFRKELDAGLMTLDDMVNSFSGEAFVKPGPAPSALFDAEADSLPAEGGDLMISSSLYGPAEGTMGIDDEDFFEGGLDTDTVESLLEQDPFEITSSPQLGDDALIRSLAKELGGHTGEQPAVIRPFFQKDCQLNKVYGGSRALGEAHEQHKKFPIQVRVRDVNIMWNMYDGYDWRRTRYTITQAVEEVEMKLEERKSSRRRSNNLEDETETVIGDCLFNSIYIGVPSAREPSDLRHSISNLINQGNDVASETESYATTGISRPTQASVNRQNKLRKKRLRLQRSISHKLGFELKGVSLDFLVHPPDSGEVQSSVDVRVADFEIFDHVPTSTWKKFLTLHDNKKNTREMMKPMIHLELLNVRPVPDLVATEMTIRVSVLPLRLHVDQDALEFMTRFFDFKDDSPKTANANAEPPFIQRLEVNTVNLCLDYKPKKIDYGGLRSGRMSEFKNLVNLEKANIKLKHAIIYGLQGFDTLHDTLSDIWTPDVMHNQLGGVLAGLGPIRPMVELGAGIRDIVAVPVAEIRKDGFKVRSVQKGAFRALSTTSSGFARLIAKVAIGTGTRLQEVEDMLSPAPRAPSNQGLPGVEGEYEESQQRVVSNYADQPLGVLQGLRSAGRYLERDLTTARDAIIAVQGEVMVSGSASGAARAVARHAPTILLQPVIGVSRAVGQTFKGVGNQVDRDYVKRTEDKYKRH